MTVGTWGPHKNLDSVVFLINYFFHSNFLYFYSTSSFGHFSSWNYAFCTNDCKNKGRLDWPYPSGRVPRGLESSHREIRGTLTHQERKRKIVITGNHCIPYFIFWSKFHPSTRNIFFEYFCLNYIKEEGYIMDLPSLLSRKSKGPCIRGVPC